MAIRRRSFLASLSTTHLSLSSDSSNCDSIYIALHEVQNNSEALSEFTFMVVIVISNENIKLVCDTTVSKLEESLVGYPRTCVRKTNGFS